MKAKLFLGALESYEIKTEKKTLKLPRPVVSEYGPEIYIPAEKLSEVESWLFKVNGYLMVSGYQVGIERCFSQGEMKK